MHLGKSLQTFLQLVPVAPKLPVLFDPSQPCYCTCAGHWNFMCQRLCCDCCCFDNRNIHLRTMVHCSMTLFSIEGSKVLHCQIIFTSKLLCRFFESQSDFVKMCTVWTILLKEHESVWIWVTGNIKNSRHNCEHSWSAHSYICKNKVLPPVSTTSYYFVYTNKAPCEDCFERSIKS